MKRTLPITLLSLFVGTSDVCADYVVNFEGAGETKTAYASGDVTLSGIPWNMTEALIGNLATDWKNGLWSARLRGYGTSAMTMLGDKPSGLGTVSFSYRRYGTDAQVDWKVEYSSDAGASWTQVGSAFTAPASDTVQTFNELVNVTGDVRIRIKRATESGATNCRLNIDDIVLTDYSGSSSLPAPTGLASSLVTAGGFTAGWNAVTGAEGYELSVFTIQTTGEWPDLQEEFVAVPGWESAPVSGTSCAVTGLVAKTTYYWSVVAVAGATSSDPSDIAEVTTLAAVGTVDPPAILSLAPAPGDGVSATCTSQSGATYALQWRASLSLPPDWQTVAGSSEVGTGSTLILTDSTDRGAACFYRVVATP